MPAIAQCVNPLEKAYYEQHGAKIKCDFCGGAYLGNGKYCPRIGKPCNGFVGETFESLNTGHVYGKLNGQKTKTRGVV